MTTSTQLEYQAETARAQIVQSIEELRLRMTPGHVMDQTLDLTRNGRAGQFVRNLGQQTVDNPIPAALIAAGFAWLMLGGRGPRLDGGAAREKTFSAAKDAKGIANDMANKAGESVSDAAQSGSDMAQRAGETVSEWRERVGDKASDLAGKARDSASRLQDAASSTGATIRDAAASAYDNATETAGSTYNAAASGVKRAGDAIGRSASAVGSTAAGGASSIAQFLKDEPLVLAGIGLALGAALGAVLPESEAENRVMGETSDALKERAAETAKQQWEKGKEAAQHVADKAWEETKHEAEAQGLMPASESEGKPSIVPDQETAAAGGAEEVAPGA